MYCSNCKKEVADNTGFCIYCGNKLITKNKNHFLPKIFGIIIAILILSFGIIFTINNNSTSNYDKNDEYLDDVVGTFKIKTSEYSWDDTKTINNNLSALFKFSDDKYIYYSTNDHLYQSKINENKFKCINGSALYKENINVIENLIYFSDNNGIYEYNPKKRTKKILSDDNPDFMRVYKGYIYYTMKMNGEKDSIYRMKIDGSEKSCIKEGAIHNMSKLTIYEDNIFYANYKKGYINKMSLDGQQSEIFLEEEVSHLHPIYIDNGYMYYEKVVGHFALASSKCRIYRIKLDGTDRQQITTIQSDSYIVYNGKIYYEGYKNWDTDSKVSLCSINVDGSNNKIIDDMKYNQYSNFFVAGNYLQYDTTTEVLSGSTINFLSTEYCLNMEDDSSVVLDFKNE